MDFLSLDERLVSRGQALSRRCGEGVRKLEGLFNHLYTDMFAVLRETIGDMRKHAWHAPPSDQEPEPASGRSLISHDAVRARTEALSEARALAGHLGASDVQLHELEGIVRRTLDRAIDSSHRAERAAAQQVIRGQLTAAIDYERSYRNRTTIRADDLLDPLFEKFDPEEVHSALASLRKSGVVDWDGESDWVEWPEVMIHLTPGRFAQHLRRGLALAR